MLFRSEARGLLVKGRIFTARLGSSEGRLAAAESFDAALALGEKLNAPAILWRAYAGQAKVAAAQGEIQQALQRYESMWEQAPAKMRGDDSRRSDFLHRAQEEAIDLAIRHGENQRALVFALALHRSQMVSAGSRLGESREDIRTLVQAARPSQSADR